MKLVRTLILAAPFLLTACDGLELVKTDTMFPYGNQRTAGSGYAYVLAKMLPEKEMKLVPAKPKPVAAPSPEMQETQKVLDKMEEVFNEKQQK